jgi:CubicO group peptidase (beta-lactamase class C family)
MRWQFVIMTFLVCAPAAAQSLAPNVVEAAVRRTLAVTQANGLAVAVIEGGKVRHTSAFGQRNARGDKLQADTVMYGASLTKPVFAYAVMQLVDAGRLDLDRPLATYLEKPLPD